jgi:hypothetical protein
MLPAPALLPVHTLRLAGRYIVALGLLFSAGRLVRHLLIQGGTTISHGSFEELRRVAALVDFAVLLLVSLTVTMAMLVAMRDGLRHGREAEAERFPDLLGRALFPFVIIYLAWSLYADDLREFQRVDLERHLLEPGASRVAGTALIIDVWWVALVATVVAWLLKFVFERWYNRSSQVAVGMVTAFFEAAFAFFTVSAFAGLLAGTYSRLKGRVLWVNATEALTAHAPGLMAAWHAVTDGLPVLLNALVLPMIWFTIACMAYGADVRPDDHRAAVAGTRLERSAERLDGVGARGRHLAAAATVGFRERWVPFVHAVRSMAGAGAPVYGMFVLCWAAVDVAVASGTRGVLHLIGPEPPTAAWPSILVPVEFAADLVREVLHLALLAAVFDLVASRTGQDGVSGERAEPAPAEGSPERARPAPPHRPPGPALPR